MSEVGERAALDSRTSLYDHALRLHQQTPDDPLPDGGRPFPDEADTPPGSPQSWKQRSAALRHALLHHLDRDDVSAAARELLSQIRGLDVSARLVSSVLEKLPLPEGPGPLALGRDLVRHGTDRRAVWVGLGLLARRGGPGDADLIRTAGLLSCCTGPAIRALKAVGCATADLIWFAERIPARLRDGALQALCERDDPVARTWLLMAPLDRRHSSPSRAREIAETARLAELLESRPADRAGAAVPARALRLLTAMTGHNDYRAEVPHYTDAKRVYAALLRRLAEVPPSLDHFADLLSLLLDLHSGHSALLDWEAGERERIAASIGAVLRRPEWTALASAAETSGAETERRRGQWIRRTGVPEPPPTGDAGQGAVHRLSVHVVVPDPAGPPGVQARLLVNGRPLIPEAFTAGPPNPPEYLLGRGLLRATDEPRRVQLAEAWCTEGCCGALYVTISREGDEVVWRHWEPSAGSPSGTERLPLPALRFEAAFYDAEITRAENDHSWEWPARTLARLLTERLCADPDLFGRWDCAAGWISTHYADHDRVEVSFTHPTRSPSEPEPDSGRPWLQFIWDLPDDGSPPEAQARAALRHLAAADPKTYARVAGGSREFALALGFPWPD
ncbi:hypothetical protein AB0B04_08425 [Streptomyces xinghaiensis]|uniref:Uncharacterized protein n=2 Tax=Streptomyces TaxID=1883 RepID=A0A3M8F7D4_9ACTN|nr:MULTISPECIES: hypothetical protein [Streptomyces]KNE82451.1 hypothetical protein ADZ36_10400 [Streptomyces fradiae]OFA49494.1 hypothetical protein BEN35_17915 [Streptomyces fradiae]PQM22885.1 hypothetical protein Sfr7A_14495 [Streptomyces xinghaiensis]RKM97360.1 hypothetical protein SFRA_009100 [Streptomyces xinghaiensis]RNC73806.1 hypothetical protein DC095_013045 [Streptomyces xinghaiensis]